MKPNKKEIRKEYNELSQEIHNRQIKPYKQALKDAETFQEIKESLLNEMERVLSNVRVKKEIVKTEIDEVIDLCNARIKELESK